MNLQLTDHLTCPRCGPEFGLILLADRVAGRRVFEGRLGCAKCRSNFVVKEGVADLMIGEPTHRAHGSDLDADRLAALLGVTEGPATLLLLGAFESAARQLAASLPDVELVVAHDSVRAGEDESGVSRLRIGDVVPLRNGGMRGVAVASGGATALVREAARVCALAARVVVTNVTADVRAKLPELGLHVLAEQADTLVAVRHR